MKLMKKGGKYKLRRGGQSGGMFYGPSHEDGGIDVHIATTGETVEAEGGEYFINAEAVKVLGVDFLDKLNRTGNRHWDSSTGFQRGELKTSSGKVLYDDGGYVPPVPEAALLFTNLDKNDWSNFHRVNGYEKETLGDIPGFLRPANATRWNTISTRDDKYGTDKMWEDSCFLKGTWEAGNFNPRQCPCIPQSKGSTATTDACGCDDMSYYTISTKCRCYDYRDCPELHYGSTLSESDIGTMECPC